MATLPTYSSINKDGKKKDDRHVDASDPKNQNEVAKILFG